MTGSKTLELTLNKAQQTHGEHQQHTANRPVCSGRKWEALTQVPSEPSWRLLVERRGSEPCSLSQPPPPLGFEWQICFFGTFSSENWANSVLPLWTSWLGKAYLLTSVISGCGINLETGLMYSQTWIMTFSTTSCSIFYRVGFSYPSNMLWTYDCQVKLTTITTWLETKLSLSVYRFCLAWSFGRIWFDQNWSYQPRSDYDSRAINNLFEGFTKKRERKKKYWQNVGYTKMDLRAVLAWVNILSYFFPTTGNLHRWLPMQS